MFESFSKLLGCNLSNLSEIMMRKGILEFFDVKSRWEISYFIMNARVEGKLKETNNTIYIRKMTLITLDGIEVET